ncbi:MAG TPA: hypothetical protein PKD26_11370 [Pyrinomonadaceae bacterium]|nr:hypothetical protein [Pyrinomonadaceae bacterium]
MNKGKNAQLNLADSGRFDLRRSSHAFCPRCDKQVELIAFENAAELFHTDLQDIQFLAANGSVHQIHNRKGKLMVCSVSLFECFDSRRTRLLDSGIIKEMTAKNSS